MDLLILAHLKSSYNEWKAVFDADADTQSAWISGDVLVAQANDRTAMIVAYGVDMEGMAAFMGTPEFAERTAAHVSGHTVYTISELPPPA
jgi:SH3-like domain-containing protein